MWTTDKLGTACKWIELGAELVPVKPRTKEIVFGYGSRQRTVRTAVECRYWFGELDYGLGLALVNGWVCADFDSLVLYDAWRAGDGRDVTTYAELTGRGAHVVWLSAGDIPFWEWPPKQSPPDIAIMRSGYIVVAPSLHPCGERYRVTCNYIPAFLTLAHAVRIFPLLSQELAAAPRARPGCGARPAGGKLDIIKASVSVIDELDAAGAMGWRRAGGALLAHCPWHDDKHPSLWAIPVKGLWGCNSPSCKAHGTHDVINARELRRGLTTHEAIRELWAEVRP